MPSSNSTAALMSLNRITSTTTAAGKKNAVVAGKSQNNVGDMELMPPPHSLPTPQLNKKRVAIQQPQQRRSNGPLSSSTDANHISRLLSSSELTNAVILSPPTVSSNNRQRQQQQRNPHGAFTKQLHDDQRGPPTVAGKTRDYDERRWEFRPDAFYSSTLPWFSGSSRYNNAVPPPPSRPFGMPRDAARLQFDALGAGEVRDDVLTKSVKHVNEQMSEVISFARIRATMMGRRKLQTADISFAARSLGAVDTTLCMPSTLGFSTTAFRHAHGVGAVKSIYAKDLRELDIASHAAQLGVADAAADAPDSGGNSGAEKVAADVDDDAGKVGGGDFPATPKTVRSMRVRMEPIVRHHWLALDGHQPAVPENPRLIPLKRQREEELLVTGPTNPSADRDGYYTAHVEEMQTHKRRKPHANFVEMHARGLQELSVEQQCLLQSIQSSLMSDDSSSALATLEKDPGIYPLLPWLIEYVVEGVRINLDLRDMRALRTLMRIVVALTLNSNVLLSAYIHRLISAVLMCVVAPTMPNADLHENNAFRYYAAQEVLLPLLTTYESAETLVHRRVVRFLLQLVQDHRKKSSPGVRYGVYCGLMLTAGTGPWASIRLDAVMHALKGESERMAEEDPNEQQPGAAAAGGATPAAAAGEANNASEQQNGIKPVVDQAEQHRINEIKSQHLAIFSLLERKIFNHCQQLLVKGDQITPQTTTLEAWLQAILGQRLSHMCMQKAPQSHLIVLQAGFDKARAKVVQLLQQHHHPQQQQQQLPPPAGAVPSLPDGHSSESQQNAVRQQHGAFTSPATHLPMNAAPYNHIPNHVNISSASNGLPPSPHAAPQFGASVANHYPQTPILSTLAPANQKKMNSVDGQQQQWHIPNNVGGGGVQLPVLSSSPSPVSNNNNVSLNNVAATALMNNSGNNTGFPPPSTHTNHVARQIVR